MARQDVPLEEPDVLLGGYLKVGLVAITEIKAVTHVLHEGSGVGFNFVHESFFLGFLIQVKDETVAEGVWAGDLDKLVTVYLLTI